MSLTSKWTSKASARQRRGRAGRTSPGHAFKLYSRKLESKWLDSMALEILKMPLEQVCLQVRAMGVSDPA